MKLDKLSFGNYLSLLVAFLFFCSCIWNIGYWGVFNINYFDFISPSDILKSMIFPFSGSIIYFIIILAYLLLTGYFFNRSLSLSSERTRPKLYTNQKHSIEFVFILFAFLFLLIQIVDVRPSLKARFSYMFISIALISLIIRFSLFKSFFDKGLKWVFCVVFCIFFPLFSFFEARHSALKRLSGRKNQIINSAIFSENRNDTTLRGKIYLGRAGNYFFVLTDSLDVSYVDANKIEKIELRFK